ncbi:MAG: hypothetical protein V4519_04140 [Patescibacteria group bacterium]
MFKKLITIITLALILLPNQVFADDPKNLKDLVGMLIGIANALVPLFFLLALIGFIIGIIKYIYSADPKKIAEARSYIVYGIITVSVMLSVWGLALLVKGSFFPSAESPLVCVVSPTSGPTSSLENVIGQIVNAGNYLVPFLILVAFIGFIIGVIKYIFSGDPKKIEDGRRFIVFSIIGMTAILSLWGIARLLSGMVFGTINSNGCESSVPDGVDYYPPGTGPTPPGFPVDTT